MFSKHVKNNARLVIKLTKLKNIQLENLLETVSKSIKNKLFHWQFSLVSLTTAF